MIRELPAALAALLAASMVAAYAIGWAGGAITASPLVIGIVAAALVARSRPGAEPSGVVPLIGWAAVTIAALILALAPTWPLLLPPGGLSDLTHHLMLVDVLERTRHLVDGASAEAALGEMAHYTPGLHLLVVIAASLAGVEAWRAIYPMLAVTMALKAGFVFLIARDALEGVRMRDAIAVTAVALVLCAPRAYGIDSVFVSGFYAQVASELFVVAGWWGLMRWRRDRELRSLAFIGLMAAATFLTWPIWIGPLIMAVGLELVFEDDVAWRTRITGAALAVLPMLVVGVMHLVKHAAWLRIAGTSGAVPRFVPGPLGWVLLALAAIGFVTMRLRSPGRVTWWFAGGIAAQALALYVLARARGAETPYMAMKMIYLAVYPAAVLGALGLATITRRLPGAAVLAVVMLVCGAGLAQTSRGRIPAPVVNLDLSDAGRWARANLPANCVDYLVDNADQAYWLHLAVMGQPRSSPRTAAIDTYTTNRAIGDWLEGRGLRYAVARRDLLPGELLREARVVRDVGAAVVLERVGVACPMATLNPSSP